MTLTKQGQRLREILAETGCEVTPDQLEDSLQEALERIRPGPDGSCVECHQTHREDGSPLDFRFGLCDECAFGPEEPDDTPKC